MPSSHEILDGLTRIANDWIVIAVLWHVAFGWLFFALDERLWLPTARIAALGVTAPIASSAGIAWIAGNPFNGLVLAAATVALTLIATRLRRVRIRRAKPATRWVGVGLIVFAWVYPHFLEGSAWLYIIASPIGVVPCPTLSLTIGVALYANSFGSRAWGITAGVFGLFYGIVGVVKLGVWIDAVLVAGAAFIVLANVRRRTPLARVSTEQRPPATRPTFA